MTTQDTAVRRQRTALPAGELAALAVAHIATKQDMSRWTRAHADAPGINWSVQAGPGGTMIITELAGDRCTLARREAADLGTAALAAAGDAQQGTP
jgi:hypothetical protein